MPAISKHLKQWLITGIAVIIPLVVTLIILLVVLDFVLGVLSPVVRAVDYLWSNEPPIVVIQATTLVSLATLILLVGFVAEHTPGRRASQLLHRSMETIPGVSTIYVTVRRASDILVDDETEQFQDVKLIEFPHQDAYVLGFLTATTPPAVTDTVGFDEMRTIMVPLGPNPTTNGFIMHMPADRIYDVDVSVEEAVQTIATLGVASNGNDID